MPPLALRRTLPDRVRTPSASVVEALPLRCSGHPQRESAAVRPRCLAGLAGIAIGLSTTYEVLELCLTGQLDLVKARRKRKPPPGGRGASRRRQATSLDPK